MSISNKSQTVLSKSYDTHLRSFSEKSHTEVTLLLPKQAPQKKKSSAIKKWAILSGAVLAILIISYFLLVHTGILSRLIYMIYHGLIELYEKSPKTTCFIIFLIKVFCLVLLLPLQSIMIFTVCALFQNYLLSYVFCMACTCTGAIMIYALCLSKIKPLLLKHIGTNPLFKVLCKYSRQYPWKTAFLARFLFISEGIKEYLLALIGNSFWPFIVSKLLIHSLYVLEIIFIHREINEIQDFMSRSSVSWREKSLAEKVSTFLIIGLVLFTMCIMAYIGVKASQIIKEVKDSEAQEEERQKEIFE